VKSFPQPIEITPNTHARFGASSAHRWVRCPASIDLQAPFPNESGAAAIEGTRAHSWLAFALQNSIDDLSGYVGFPHLEYPTKSDASDNVLAAELADVLNDALAYVFGLLRDSDELWIEKTWAAPMIHAEAFGTADIVIRRPNGGVYVIDYKNGTQQVPVHGNMQLMFYGLASRGLDGAPVTGVIIQNSYGRAMIREHEFTEDELQAFLWDAVTAAAAIDAEPVPGAHCKYCRAAASNCSAIAKLSAEVIAAPSVPGLTPDSAGDALRKVAALEAYCAAVQSQAMAMALRGTPPTGYKLVEGRASREFTNPDAPRIIEAASGVKLHKTEWMTVAQAEKALGKKGAKHLDGMWSKKPGSPKLVPAEYPAKEITPAPRNGFDTIDI
jgi:hypothetical protein